MAIGRFGRAGGVSERGTSYEGQRPPSGRGSGERRVALVIGKSASTSTAPLTNPVNHATAMAAALQRPNFEVLHT